MGFKIRVNGEVVYETEGSPLLVNSVTIASSRGEVATVGFGPTDDFLDITVMPRDAVMTGDLDIIEEAKAQARRDVLEGEAEKRREENPPTVENVEKPSEEVPSVDFGDLVTSGPGSDNPEADKESVTSF